MTKPDARKLEWKRCALWTAVLCVAALFCWPIAQLLVRVARHTEVTSELLRPLVNSLYLASSSAVVGTVLAGASAYALTWGHFPGRKWAVIVLTALAVLPGQVLLPGGFEMVTRLGFFDTHLALLVPGCVNLFGMLMYRAAFHRVPGELLSAARVDGCGEWGVFWRVAMPAVLPTTSALLLISFTATYNATVWPAITIQSRSLETLSTYLAVTAGTALTPSDHARAATTTAIALAPPMGLFLLLQRSFLPTLRGAGK